MNEPTARDFQILLVEDNDDDVFLIRKAIAQTSAPVTLEVAVNGDLLMQELARRCAAGAALPAVVLLDINMPRLDGFQVLRAIKADPALRHIPILILTTSGRREDVQRAYDLGASSFFTKPAEFDDLVALMEQIFTYWRRVTRLPMGS